MLDATTQRNALNNHATASDNNINDDDDDDDVANHVVVDEHTVEALRLLNERTERAERAGTERNLTKCFNSKIKFLLLFISENLYHERRSLKNCARKS